MGYRLLRRCAQHRRPHQPKCNEPGVDILLSETLLRLLDLRYTGFREKPVERERESRRGAIVLGGGGVERHLSLRSKYNHVTISIWTSVIYE